MIKLLAGDAGPLSALVTGPEDGIPVLLLHGMAGNAHWWDTTIPLLGPEFLCAALDMRGHGDSARADPPRYDLDDFASDVEAARKGLGFKRFHLVGHSMGARAAIHYVKDHAEHLLSLTLVDFLADFGVEASRKFRRPSFRRQPTYADPQELVSRFRLEPAGTLLTQEELARLALHCIQRTPEGRWTWKFDWSAFGTAYIPIWPYLHQISMPAMVVRGGLSTVMPPEAYARILSELPGAEGHEIAAAHHHVPLDTPVELAALMRAFLLKHAASVR